MKRILIIRFSSIGDIVLTTPVIRCLKEQLEDVDIHYLTKKEFGDVLKGDPNIDRLHLLSSSIHNTIQELKGHSFDLVVDLHRNLRSYRVTRELGRPTKRLNKLNREKWLMVNFKADRLPRTHIVDRYLKPVKQLGVVNDKKGLDYYIPPDENLSEKFLPAEIRDGFVAFGIGGAHFTKCLPEEKIIRICDGLSSPIALLGGEEDREKGERIRERSKARIWNTCGDLRINSTASLIRMATHVISHDTAIMHIAAAFRKPIVSIWGNTIPAFGMTPYMPGNENKSTIVEVKGLECRPCSKIGFNRCPKGHFKCMWEIDEEAVIEAVE